MLLKENASFTYGKTDTDFICKIGLAKFNGKKDLETPHHKVQEVWVDKQLSLPQWHKARRHVCIAQTELVLLKQIRDKILN